VDARLHQRLAGSVSSSTPRPFGSYDDLTRRATLGRQCDTPAAPRPASQQAAGPPHTSTGCCRSTACSGTMQLLACTRRRAGSDSCRAAPTSTAPACRRRSSGAGAAATSSLGGRSPPWARARALPRRGCGGWQASRWGGGQGRLGARGSRQHRRHRQRAVGSSHSRVQHPRLARPQQGDQGQEGAMRPESTMACPAIAAEAWRTDLLPRRCTAAGLGVTHDCRRVRPGDATCAPPKSAEDAAHIEEQPIEECGSLHSQSQAHKSTYAPCTVPPLDLHRPSLNAPLRQQYAEGHGLPLGGRLHPRRQGSC
jgi:hypothetical protein